MRDILVAKSEIENLLHNLTEQILKDISNSCAIIGISKKGRIIGKRIVDILKQRTEKNIEYGYLDPSLYSNKFDENQLDQKIFGSNIEFDLNGKKVIIVDHIIHTGETARAAIEGITEKGQPNEVKLAVLFDRGGRKLPIQPDYTGREIVATDKEFVMVYLEEFDGKDEVRLVNW